MIGVKVRGGYYALRGFCYTAYPQGVCADLVVRTFVERRAGERPATSGGASGRRSYLVKSMMRRFGCASHPDLVQTLSTFQAGFSIRVPIGIE
jgi:hypothetical protein